MPDEIGPPKPTADKKLTQCCIYWQSFTQSDIKIYGKGGTFGPAHAFTIIIKLLSITNDKKDFTEIRNMYGWQW